MFAYEHPDLLVSNMVFKVSKPYFYPVFSEYEYYISLFTAYMLNLYSYS